MAPQLYFRLALTVVGVVFSLTTTAQTRFNYQAIVRDANDSIVPDHPVNLRFTLHQDAQMGLPVYQEEHTGLNTSSIGLVNLHIGAGTIGFGSLDSINWIDHQYFMQVEADLQNGFGYLEMGTSPIVSVPLAEYAKKSGKPWQYNANGIHYTQGFVGIGDSLPQERLHVQPAILITGDSVAPTDTRIQMHAASAETGNYVSSFDENGNRLWIMDMADRDRDNAITFYSQKVEDNVLLLDPDGGLEVHANSHSKIRLYAYPDHDNYISAYNSSGDQKWIINMGTSSPGTNEPFAIYSNEADGGNGQYLMYLLPDGTTQVRCLEILGGCDINERFNSTELLEPGTVVIADVSRPGEIRMTNKPYDQSVIGVISGANGIKPGITLSQENVLDGDYRVALSGRVYVKVAGTVKIGDLLTTSSENGKAMAVKNFNKAFGAVIGKALESDADRDGLVLMLVQPR